MSTYPFGRPATDRPPRVPRGNADVFVLGVYASALHVRWQRPDGAVMVQALAVDDEPEVFWDGADAEERIARWRRDVGWQRGWGRVTSSGQRDVGSSTGGRRARPTRDIDRPVSRHRLPASLSREARAPIARASHGEGLRSVRRGSRLAPGFVASTTLRSRARAASGDGRPWRPCRPSSAGAERTQLSLSGSQLRMSWLRSSASTESLCATMRTMGESRPSGSAVASSPGCL